MRLHEDMLSGSRVGGFVAIAVTLSSIMSTMVIAVLNIFWPGWADESR